MLNLGRGNESALIAVKKGGFLRSKGRVNDPSETAWKVGRVGTTRKREENRGGGQGQSRFSIEGTI